jgi:hypothetical protein
MKAHTTTWSLILALAGAACGGTRETAAPGRNASPDANLTSGDYGGPARVGVPSDEAGGTSPSTPIEARVVAVDPQAPSITAVPPGASAGAQAREAKTIAVEAAAAADLKSLKAGDRVTLMCAVPSPEGEPPATGSPQPGLQQCGLVLSIGAPKAPAPAAGR